MLYACDYAWWKQYVLEVSRTAKGELWSVSTRAAKEYKTQWIRGEPHRGVSQRADVIHTGSNSGYQAIGLAYLWGASRILLLGYDFKHQGAKRHWHGDHPHGMGNASGNFGRWCQSMAELAADLKTAGVEVVNCSRETALKCFPRSTINKELEGIK